MGVRGIARDLAAAGAGKLKNLSKNEKIVDIGIKLKTGEVVPAGAKKIWPVYCWRK